MNDRDREYEQEVQRVNDSVSDGGGCVEAWSSLSELRADDGGNRRSFIKTVGVALGAVSLGASTTASAEEGSEGADIETTDVHGEDRKAVLDRAESSRSLEFVVDQLGSRGEVVSVLEYHSSDGPSGRVVTYGTSGDTEGQTIQYYESDAFDGGTRVTGSKPSGGGATIVDGDREVVIYTHDTPRHEEVIGHLDENKEYQRLKRSLDRQSLRENEAAVTESHEGQDVSGQYIVPLAEDGEVVNRVYVSGDGDLSVENVRSYSVAVEKDHATRGPSIQATETGVGTNQIEFDPCTALCGAISGLSGAACFSACSGTVVGIPISPGCSAICAGAAAGVCVPTCNNLT